MLAATTLTLDLGTKTGYALGTQGAQSIALTRTTACGTWVLLTEKDAKEQRKRGLERLGDARYYRLRDLVLQFCRVHNVSRIVFEDVKFCHSALQTQLWSSLRTALWEVRDRLAVELRAVPTSTLKSFACAKPTANKAEMESALRARQQGTEGSVSLGDDNEIDARWLLYYALAVDEGTQNWAFGWQLKVEQRIATKAKRTLRRLEQKERHASASADGLKRLDLIVKELGERITLRAARQAVIELCRSKRHTLVLKSHVIVGSVLKGGGLRWEIS
jgi:hypothetical protein